MSESRYSLLNLRRKVEREEVPTYVITRAPAEAYQRDAMDVLLSCRWIELRYNPSIHAKVYVASATREADSFALFGSGNLTMRSLKSNIELGMLVYSEGPGREILRQLHYWTTVRLRTSNEANSFNLSERRGTNPWISTSGFVSRTVTASLSTRRLIPPMLASISVVRPFSTECKGSSPGLSWIPQVPKMLVWGPYGSGKTQTLYFLADWLVKHKPASCRKTPHVVHLEIEVKSKSTASHWHIQMVEALEMNIVQAWLQQLFAKSADFDKELTKITADPNIIRAFGHLRGSGPPAFNAWRWLSGQTLSATELQILTVTRSLGDVGVGDLVSVLQAFGNLANSIGECLIFFVDEMEELLNVREGDSAESWHQYLRKLADNANSSVGFLIGFKADTRDDAPRILIREDVRSRIGENNYIELETLAAPANVKEFVEELLQHLVDQQQADDRIKADTLASTVKTYPFTATAFDLLCDYACQDAIKSTPRNIIKTINECAIAAWDAQKRVVDDEIVNEIAPIIFG